MKKFMAAIAIAATVATLQGCATSASIQGMTTQKALASNAALREKIAVAPVSGGKTTNPLWTSQVGSADFEAALKASLKAASLLSPAAGPLSLKAELVSLQQPTFGLDMTVKARVHYTLTDAQGSKIYDEFVETPYTATVSDAFVGTKRLQLANEGAIRVNIEALIQKLESLNIRNVSLR